MGGVPVSVLNLLKHIDNGGVTVEIAAPNDGVFFDKMADFVKMHDIKIRGFYPATLFYLKKLIKNNGYNIVHAHGRGAGLYARLACLGLKVRIVYSYHGFFYRQYPIFVRWIYLVMEKILALWTDKIVCVSEGEKKLAMQTGVLSGQRAEVIPNGIEHLGYEKKKEERNGYVIGTLSKICVQKGLEYLIGAVAELKDKYSGLICLIAGGTLQEDKKREAMLKEMVSRLGIKKNVFFLGEVSDVTFFLKQLDLYVSASLWEGLPTAVIEAALAKIPLVATDVIGNNEVVLHNKTGILVKPQDSGSLARGIDFAFSNPQKLDEFCDNAFTLVSSTYTVKKMIENYELMYSSLLNHQYQ
jgi:glycosyltransferase involved in cell wall biosynthesis